MERCEFGMSRLTVLRIEIWCELSTSFRASAGLNRVSGQNWIDSSEMYNVFMQTRWKSTDSVEKLSPLKPMKPEKLRFGRSTGSSVIGTIIRTRAPRSMRKSLSSLTYQNTSISLLLTSVAKRLTMKRHAVSAVAIGLRKKPKQRLAAGTQLSLHLVTALRRNLARWWRHMNSDTPLA